MTEPSFDWKPASGRFLASALLFAASLASSASARAGFDEAARALAAGEHAAAFAEMRPLAERGDPRAQEAVATMYLKGLGVERDVRAAMGWYCRLVHHPPGGRAAMHAAWLLAEYFRTGGATPGARYHGSRPGEVDPIRAYFWYSVMAGQEGIYRQVDASSVTLGKIGAGSVVRELYDEERAAVRSAVEAWDPGQAVGSGEACLRLPEDVDPAS